MKRCLIAEIIPIFIATKFKDNRLEKLYFQVYDAFFGLISSYIFLAKLIPTFL